jgi:cullin-associated NEDD8-dissociated protein 1
MIVYHSSANLVLLLFGRRASVSVLQVCPNAGPAVKAHALEPALTLSTSSLLQDLALNSLLEFFKQLIVSQAVEFDELLFLLRQRLVKISKTGVYNLSKSIAVITAASTPENNQKVLSEMLSTLEGAAAPCNSAKVRQLQLALLVTGDLGRMVDMGQLDGAAERLKVVYMSYFDATSEDLKSAAAYALGNASVGSQAIFLPSIVRKLDEDNTKQQYLLLLALREFIQCSFDKSVGVDIASSMPIIVPTLVKHGSDDEEGVRTMVAECIGLLTCLHPESMLPKLLELQEQHCDISAPGGMIADGDDDSKKNALVSWSIATSVKLSIAGKVNASQLSVFMPKFVKMLKQEEIGVRNAALLMTYAASHHMPKIVASLLQDSIMPSLYEISNLKLERKVDLGPFTHKVDDALPLRKSALSIFATCLESLPGSLDINDFIPILVKALGDAEDIQLHAHQIVISMCSSQPTHLLASIESFVEPLEKNLNRKPGQKVGTELERLNDWIKSALRVVLALSKLEGAMNVRAFADFVNRSQNNSKFAAMIESLQHEA